MEDALRAVDAHGAFEAWEDLGDGDGEACDVIEVGVGEDDVTDVGELCATEGEAEATGVNGDGVVDQESGQRLRLGAIAQRGRKQLDL